MRTSHSRHAATLVETLVVIGIIGVLVGLTLSAVQRVRDAASRSRCANHLRQIGLALHSWHNSHGRLPPGWVDDDVEWPESDAYGHMSWHTRILPDMGESPLWGGVEDAYRRAATSDNFWEYPPHPFDVVISAYLCPSVGRPTARYPTGYPPGPMYGQQTGYALTSYPGVEGIGHDESGVLYPNSRVRFADVTDGVAHTLMAGERTPPDDGTHAVTYCSWYGGFAVGRSVLGVQDHSIGYHPPCGGRHYRQFGPGTTSDFCHVFHYWSLHSGGGHFLFCDGNVRFVSYSAARLLPALATRADGEPAELP